MKKGLFHPNKEKKITFNKKKKDKNLFQKKKKLYLCTLIHTNN